MKFIRSIFILLSIGIIVESCAGSKGSHRCQTCPKFSQVKSTSQNLAS